MFDYKKQKKYKNFKYLLKLNLMPKFLSVQWNTIKKLTIKLWKNRCNENLQVNNIFFAKTKCLGKMPPNFWFLFSQNNLLHAFYHSMFLPYICLKAGKKISIFKLQFSKNLLHNHLPCFWQKKYFLQILVWCQLFKKI